MELTNVKSNIQPQLDKQKNNFAGGEWWWASGRLERMPQRFS